MVLATGQSSGTGTTVCLSRPHKYPKAVFRQDATDGSSTAGGCTELGATAFSWSWGVVRRQEEPTDRLQLKAARFSASTTNLLFNFGSIYRYYCDYGTI